ncbi:arylsulfatase J-like [Babylonia areolata]|uniref:arylsulfatase J-like n=1 Tax=Babylonia areolata TaxID=304850 RepID=UPI003FD1777F
MTMTRVASPTTTTTTTLSSVTTILHLLPLLLLLLATPTTTTQAARKLRPHIVVLMADDLGWGDVGFRDPQMATPNIDRLAEEGVNLTNSYMQQACAPSRAAFLSGYYPFRMGLQSLGIAALRNNSLPLNKKKEKKIARALHGRTFPQDLQELGYSTHMVGKWHLGFCKLEMTPTYRGFHTFYGMYNGKGDYYTHTSKLNGYDLQSNTGQGSERNFTADWSANGTYSTELFTDRAVDIIEKHDESKPLFLFLSYQAVHGPLQVPERYVTQFCANVTHDRIRALHCAMAAAMDEGIGRVLRALEDRGFDDNLVTLFTTDNGGPVKQGSSNWPLRGGKMTLWEGGTRAVTILHSRKLLPDAPYSWRGLMHAVDWYPTLLRAAGRRRGEGVEGLDGVDNWWRILNNRVSNRIEFVYNIDDVKVKAALRYKRYKLVRNKPGSPDGWYNPPADVVNNHTQPRGRYPEYMLFNLRKDPEETTDIIHDPKLQALVAEMKEKLSNYTTQILPSASAHRIKLGAPEHFGGAWTPGWC